MLFQGLYKFISGNKVVLFQGFYKFISGNKVGLISSVDSFVLLFCFVGFAILFHLEAAIHLTEFRPLIVELGNVLIIVLFFLPFYCMSVGFLEWQKKKWSKLEGISSLI